MDLYEQIQEAVQTIHRHTQIKPEVAVILGTGLGALVKDIQNNTKIPYAQIPFFPLSTVETHAGQLIVGELMGKTVVVMQGRFHRYEGYDFKQITFPVRVMRALGAETLFVFSACGGINPDFYAGDLALLCDHINLMGETPLVGPNEDRLGPRFPDMFNVYNDKLQALAQEVARDQKLTLHRAVYAALTGPNLETVAEYRFLQIIGADCVGMSTVPEVIVAQHAGMRILGIAVVTDRCVPGQVGPADIQEIIQAAMAAEPKLTKLVKDILRRLKN